VTIARRLAKVEAALTPTELVLRWLDEAHAHGDLESYVRAQLAESPPDTPINRLAHEAVAGATATSRGKGAEATQVAVRTALGATVFRFELVMRITNVSHERIDRELLVSGVIAPNLALLAGIDATEREHEPAYLRRLASLRDLAVARVDDLLLAQQARAQVEARYLGGRAVLYPVAVAAWDEQVHLAQQLAAMAIGLADLDGVPPVEPDEADAAARFAVLVAGLVEPAKVTALEKLGEGERAFRIAAGWVRGRLGAADPSRAATP
jgi:hypothetical protein